MERKNAELIGKQSALIALAKQKSAGFPYLADAWAEFLALRDKAAENHLRYKSHPAAKAAITIRQFASERREAIRAAKVSEYKLKLYEALFPWITQFTEEGIEDSYIRIGSEGAEDTKDPATKRLSEGEYRSLSTTERNQRALDRYCARKNKTPWEIGRDYERYVGHLFESNGLSVTYMGALEGFDDLGRDLVIRGAKRIKIVQCKYWAQRKEIHEKHLFQLFGTAVEFALRNRLGGSYDGFDLFGSTGLLEEVEPVFYTSTKLTERSRAFARALGVTVYESCPLAEYPMIKCNVSRAGQERIYHLPFDQQYDKVRVEPHRGECFVRTVVEAEKLGARRAFRWRGQSA